MIVFETYLTRSIDKVHWNAHQTRVIIRFPQQD